MFLPGMLQPAKCTVSSPLYDEKHRPLGASFLKMRLQNTRGSFALLASMTKNRSQTSSRAFVLCAEIHQTIRHQFLRSRSFGIHENLPKQSPEISQIWVRRQHCHEHTSKFENTFYFTKFEFFNPKIVFNISFRDGR